MTSDFVAFDFHAIVPLSLCLPQYQNADLGVCLFVSRQLAAAGKENEMRRKVIIVVVVPIQQRNEMKWIEMNTVHSSISGPYALLLYEPIPLVVF